MNKAVKVLIVLILVSVVFSAPVFATTQQEETPESEDYKKRHEERGERGVPPATPVPPPATPVPTGYAIGYEHGDSGWCLLATVAHGTTTAEEIDVLRDFRDTVLNQNPVGELLVSAYYDVSPPLAEFIAEHSNLRTIARVGIVEPMIRALELSDGIWNAS